MRFIGLEIAGWEALFLSRVMSRTNVRNLIPHRQALTEHIRNQDHTVHACENRLCPISCQFCKRLCSGDHLHGLSADENHLCGYAHFFVSPTLLFTWTSSQEHSCNALCSADGICHIDTTPLSIEATFVGRHENFQYTKVSACLSIRLHRSLQGTLVYPECVI